MTVNLMDLLIRFPLTPHEDVEVSRLEATVDEYGAEDTKSVEVGTYTVMIAPPDTLNKNDGAILEQLMRGIGTRKVYMMYGRMPDIKEGDTVKRIQGDGLEYEVKIVANHGYGFSPVAVTHEKCYIVLKDNQKRGKI